MHMGANAFLSHRCRLVWEEIEMKRGFMLMNTGAPDAPTEGALSTFLEEFLEDSSITDIPKLVRAPMVHWIVLPQHLQEMVAAYASIWTDKGCPPVQYTLQLARDLEQKLGVPVVAGMAHGNPTYMSALINLLNKGVNEIGLLWMFPQYDLSKHTCVHNISRELKRLESNAILRVAPTFYEEPSYIEPHVAALRDNHDFILFNYHGLSTHSIKQADPTHHHCLTASTCCNEGSLAHDTCYRFQCFNTSRSIAQAAGIPQDRYGTSFQTRRKYGKWLEPHTEDALSALPAEGHKRVTVLNPGFFCDCLETLEEVGMRGKYIFLEAGGESFRMIPCFNDSPTGLQCLETLISNTDHWPVEWTPKHAAEEVSA